MMFLNLLKIKEKNDFLSSWSWNWVGSLRWLTCFMQKEIPVFNEQGLFDTNSKKD